MDKNRVVTFGSMGGQNVPSSLDISNVVGSGWIFKGIVTQYVTDYLKYLYYGYAVSNGSSTMTDNNYYIPVFNDGNYTYVYLVVGRATGQNEAEGIKRMILYGFVSGYSGNFSLGGICRCTLSSLSNLNEENTVNDIYFLESFDPSTGTWTEALDENGDPVFYAEKRTIENS